MIEDIDAVQEGGVEIVPFVGSYNDDTKEFDTSLELENKTDHVWVFYVKDDTKQIMNDANNTMNGERTTTQQLLAGVRKYRQYLRTP